MFGPYIAVSKTTLIGNNRGVVNSNITMWSSFWSTVDAWPYNVAVVRSFLILLVIFTFGALACSGMTMKGSDNGMVPKAGILCDLFAWVSAMIVFAIYTSEILMEFYGYGFAFDVVCFCLSFLAMCGAIFDMKSEKKEEPTIAEPPAAENTV